MEDEECHGGEHELQLRGLQLAVLPQHVPLRGLQLAVLGDVSAQPVPPLHAQCALHELMLLTLPHWRLRVGVVEVKLARGRP